MISQKISPKVAFAGIAASDALIFPFVMLLQFMTPLDMTVVYYGVMVLVGYLFVSKIEVKKPGVKGVMILCIIGALEFLIMMILRASTH